MPLAREDGHTFDVAISLRSTDKRIGREVYDLLGDRLDVFYAYARHEEFAGTDGEQTFAEVFRDRARLVVILYREDWGETQMTRAEKQGIKQRAPSDGYDFTLWVAMEDDVTKRPAFVPLDRIWFEFKNYGVAGLAATIENRVRDLGLKVRASSQLDEIGTLRRKRLDERRRHAFIHSEEGVAFWNEEVGRVHDLLQHAVSEIEGRDPDIRFIPQGVTGQMRGLRMGQHAFRGFIMWDNRRWDSAERAVLRWEIQRHTEGTAFEGDAWKLVHRKEFGVDLDEDGKPTWRGPDKAFVSLQQIVEEFSRSLAILVAKGMEADARR